MSQNVRIVFTASQSWFGKAIRWCTNAGVSHVFIEFDVWGRRMVLESTIGGTRIVPAKRSRHDVVREYKLKADGKQPIIDMMGYLGTEYDYTGVLLMAWIKIAWRWFGLKLSYPTWSSKALKCSELVFLFMKKVVPGQFAIPGGAEMANPQHIMRICEAHQELFEKVV